MAKKDMTKKAKTKKAKTRKKESTRARAMLEPVIERLERLEEKADATRKDLREATKGLKFAARAAGITGLKYMVFVALTIVNPKEALAKISKAVDDMDQSSEPGEGDEEIADKDGAEEGENDDDDEESL